MKIIVASQNPVKINAVQQGFQKAFPQEVFVFEAVSATSNVSDQPQTNDETFKGAWNRAENASELILDADFWVGLESGVHAINDELTAFSWVIIKSRDNHFGKGKTLTFFLPPAIIKLMQEGNDLGKADDIVFGRTNSAQEAGAIGLLTNNVITRTSYYADAVVIALIPFKNQELYF